ncbi:hypothetical protein LTR37_019948 [Vermiconidia calcicola]|uniref:Uncharacterized protein n=1 Tax=Vermiconidia calcicola TaxID=1690605 RepID=A0ACC3MCM7_9PEZI|nr:hypothetical protein LTR37_019948 [Vermiconidia calcicola]
MQPVEADGITLALGSRELLDNNGEADQGIIEAPSLVRMESKWILFFSSGCFATKHYTVSYATSNSIAGPYTRADKPLFKTGDDGLFAPGVANAEDSEDMY